MGFELLKGITLWKEVKTKTPSYWDKGILKEGEVSVDYIEFTGHWSPMSPEEGELLPTGISCRQAIWVHTGHILNTYSGFNSDTSIADKIFIKDPRSGRKRAVPYTVTEVEEYILGSDFELIEDEFAYICIREGKLNGAI